MAKEKRHYTRQELQNAVAQGWRYYLACLHALSEDELARYAQEQGFARVQDVLVHIIAWWERSMDRSYQIISGLTVPRSMDMDEFNAQVVAQYQLWTRQAVEIKFAVTLNAFERFLQELAEDAIANERIQLWLRIDAINHYQDHRLPNAPQLFGV